MAHRQISGANTAYPILPLWRRIVCARRHNTTRERVVIPTAIRPEIKMKVHAGHQGIDSCLCRARELVYWPGMSSEIGQYVESCDSCASYVSKQTPETLRMHEVPTRPFQKVGTDLFTIGGKDYLITVDYHSHYFEVDYLPDTLSMTIINKLKHHFARHGIRDIVISDNGPQYISDSFHRFANEWNFDHQTSSPGNSKSNGRGSRKSRKEHDA